jgi:hypothetical protein
MIQVMERGRKETDALEDGGPTPRGLRAADPNEFIPVNMSSVTDQTTRHLENVERKIR